MKNHIIVVALSVAVFAVSNSSFAQIKGNYKFSKVYKSNRGDVPFLHERHAVRFIEDCAFCHSALKTFGGKVNEMFAHKVCKVCHESNNGPKECNECHGRVEVTMD